MREKLRRTMPRRHARGLQIDRERYDAADLLEPKRSTVPSASSSAGFTRALIWSPRSVEAGFVTRLEALPPRYTSVVAALSEDASDLDDPDGLLGLDRYRALHGVPHTRPLPLEDFVRYGLWFQQRAAPDVDRRRVTFLAERAGGFHVRLEDGEEFPARRVVVATGIGPFARRPGPFAGLPASLVSHSV